MIYVSSACLKNRTIGETVKQLAEAGIRNIELSGGTAYYSCIEDDLISLREKYGLKYVCHSYFPPPKEDFVVNLASCNDEIYEKSKKHYFNCIDMLRRLQIRVLSIHAGFLFETNPVNLGKLISLDDVYKEEKAYDRFCDAYNLIQKKCSDNDIELYLENNVLSLENYKSWGNRNLLMMTEYDSIEKMRNDIEFNLLLDLAHLRVSCTALGLDFKSQYEKLIGSAKWFHVSENNGIVDQHLPLIRNSELHKCALVAKGMEYNITLETNGSVLDIQNSMMMI